MKESRIYIYIYVCVFYVLTQSMCFILQSRLLMSILLKLQFTKKSLTWFTFTF